MRGPGAGIAMAAGRRQESPLEGLEGEVLPWAQGKTSLLMARRRPARRQAPSGLEGLANRSTRGPGG
jgi:hypothetical protein